MVDSPLWHLIENRVFMAESTETLFNPYREAVNGLDCPGAAGIRRENLRKWLGSFPARPPLLIVGEAPGWRGCRFSGVPFVGEAQLEAKRLPFCGRRTSCFESPVAEATATIFWNVMRPYHPHFFAWNCIPWHPHRAGEPLSNRRPGRREIAEHQGLLSEMIALLRPAQVVALGRSAEYALERIGASAIYVRHPSHGGTRLFEAGMRSILEKMAIGAN